MAKKKKSRVSESSKFEEENETENHQSDAEMGDDNGGSDEEKKTLYEILGVQQTASQQEIKKTYHNLALLLHPDKNPDDKETNEKFHQLRKVMSILGDKQKRALYDQIGVIDDDDLAGDAQNLHNFFPTMYKKEASEPSKRKFENRRKSSENAKNRKRKAEEKAPGASKTKPMSRENSLYAAGAIIKAGCRRSTRIKNTPLKYWIGERFLYGRVHDSRSTVIGVKYASPSKEATENPTFKVKSFVSDEYRYLVDLAALH